MIAEIFLGAIALLAVGISLVLAQALRDQIREAQQLQEDHDLLKYCHDDHYQSMLELMEETGRLSEALEFYADVGGYNTRLDWDEDTEHSKDLLLDVRIWLGHVVTDCGKVARQALEVLPDRSAQEPQPPEEAQGDAPKEGWQPFDTDGHDLYHYMTTDMVTLCGLASPYWVDSWEHSEIPEDQLCPECLEALKRECPYEIVGGIDENGHRWGEGAEGE
jgi:hypothetical protein